MKKTFLVTSLIISSILLLVAYRENLNMKWQSYQKEYKEQLQKLAQTEKEKSVAQNYEIKMRQIVLPELNRTDRCVICHVGMEDARMKNMSNPLKTHPGDYLEKHDVEKVGCTVCHDGQGRAITLEESKARGHGKYWEKPALIKPFIEANCYRCHKGTLEETPIYDEGKVLFESKGCLGCHQVDGKGGIKGPELSNIGNASFHIKMPLPENREELLHEFSDNVNLAYIYEAVKEPHAQPDNSAMVDYHFSKKEAVALTVYLKSLLEEDVPGELKAKSTELTWNSPLEHGAQLYGKYCTVCHGAKGEGTHLKELDKIGPAIGNSEFLSIADDKLLKHVISYARGGDMPPFKTTVGLTEEEIDNLVIYVKSFKMTPPTFEEVSQIKGNAQYGESFFAMNCASCHGSEGKHERDLVGPSLNNPLLQGLATRKFWYNTIVKGRSGTAMPSWHFLSAEKLADLIEYLESLKSKPLNQEKVLSLLNNGQASAEFGRKLFVGKCSTCHGLNAEGSLAPSLNNNSFYRIADAKKLIRILSEGREGTAMASWNHLSEEDIADIIAYLKTFQTTESITLSDKKIIGSERLGAKIFQKQCDHCHGIKWSGMIAPIIQSEGFLRQSSDHYIKETVTYGRDGTQMKPYGKGLGGVAELSEEEINAVVAYIRSFEDNPVVLEGKALIQGDPYAGKESFARSCAQCHGQYAEGGVGPAIGKKGFLDTVSDGFIYAMVRVGREGSEMKAFPPHGDGFRSLDEAETLDIISFLRSNVEEAEKHKKKVRGYPQHGKELFERNCAQCHGKKGLGGIAPALNSHNFMEAASDSYLQATMALGRHGTQMKPMMKGGSGVVELSSQDVNDIISYLKMLVEETKGENK